MNRFTAIDLVLLGALAIVARGEGYDTQPEGPAVRAVQANSTSAHTGSSVTPNPRPAGRLR